MQIHNLLSNDISATIEILGKKWSDTLKKYERKYESTDSIHWYIERTNVGALATAAWLCDGVAIEEYTTTKENGKEYNGRCDLYFHVGNVKAICESKMEWIELKPTTDLKNIIAEIIGTIKLAQSDSNAHITPHRKMFAAFICTYWTPQNDDGKIQSTAEYIIEGFLKNQENAASYKYLTDKNLISSAGNVCNLAYLIIGDA